jgi:hypothetical protein
MKKLTINNLDKIQHSSIRIGICDWVITSTVEPDSGDGYVIILNSLFGASSIWVSREIGSDGWIKVIRRWNTHEWVGWVSIIRLDSPYGFVLALEGVGWNLVNG